MIMNWIIIAIYFIGIFATHLIIYKDGEEGIDHNAANIACVAWPVTLLICGLLLIERLIRRFLRI